jgi:hypothetical protein
MPTAKSCADAAVVQRSLVDLARITRSEATRARAISDASAQVSLSSGKVGTNLTYQIGAATVMF